MQNTKFKHLRNGDNLYFSYISTQGYEIQMHTILQVKLYERRLHLTLQNTHSTSYVLPLFNNELDKSWVKIGTILYATNKDDILKEKVKYIARRNYIIRKLRT